MHPLTCRPNRRPYLIRIEGLGLVLKPFIPRSMFKVKGIVGLTRGIKRIGNDLLHEPPFKVWLGERAPKAKSLVPERSACRSSTVLGSGFRI